MNSDTVPLHNISSAGKWEMEYWVDCRGYCYITYHSQLQCDVIMIFLKAQITIYYLLILTLNID